MSGIDLRDLEEKELQAERLRLLGECVAGIAHELNNPLTGVIGYLQLAAKGDISPDLKAAVEKAASEAGRMASTIRALLSFVRRHEPERVPTDLGELARQVVAFQGYHLAAKDIALEVEVAQVPRALVDPHQIRQVLLNLVKNAVDASLETGGGVEVGWEVTGRQWLVKVRDEGPGLSETANLFVPFYSTRPEGTGIGLVLCRQIAEAHGGSVILENRSDTRGCEARVVLPLRPSFEA